MWACELGFSPAGLLVGVHLMGAGCVMGNGLGAVVQVSGDRPLVITAAGGGTYTGGLTVDGRACGDDWLTFAELTAGGALAYCTGTSPDTGWAAGPAATAPAYCAG
jgi:hypothetical protein